MNAHEETAGWVLGELDGLISKHVIDQGSVETGWTMRGLIDQLVGDPTPGEAGDYEEDYRDGIAAAKAIRAAFRKRG